MAFKLLWPQSKMSYFQYGSVLSYGANGQVHFEHELLSPGTTLVSWSSSVNYFESRSPLELPLLERGQRYRLCFKGEVSPANSVLVKLEFFDRVSTSVGVCFLELGVASFIYPKTAYSYRLSLLSTGLQQLTFDSILLSKMEEEKKES